MRVKGEQRSKIREEGGWGREDERGGDGGERMKGTGKGARGRV